MTAHRFALAAALLAIGPLALGLARAGQVQQLLPDAPSAGAPQACIPRAAIRDVQVRSDQVIDFELTGGRAYRNTLSAPCPDLAYQARLGYSTSTSELCAGDIVTVLYTSPVQTGARCGLGSFQPVRLPERRRR